MKKKILIIRSINMQQLDNLMETLYTEYPEDEFYLLTHPHAKERCKKYKRLTYIYDYESRKKFNFFHIPKILKKQKFDILIIPVTNISGAGFLNVFMMSLRIKSKTRFIYNLKSEKQKIRAIDILYKFGKTSVFSIFASVSTLILSPFVIIYLIISKIKNR